MPAPPVHSSPRVHHTETSALLSILKQTTTTPTTTSETTTNKKRSKSKLSSGGGGLLKMFKLFPMLTTGCKMVTLLSRPRGSKSPALLRDRGSATGTIFGPRKGRVTLAIQDDPHSPAPVFLIELPINTASFHREMASDVVRIALESETRSYRKQLMEEFVWAVYCNGRKMGYSIRRSGGGCGGEDEVHVMRMLRGVSMGAGVLPPAGGEGKGDDGELTYIRGRFERVVGSKDSEALYMINPDGAVGPELSLFFVRAH